MPYTPSNAASAIANQMANTLATYTPPGSTSPLTAMQQAIAGGNLGPMATVDGWLSQATEPVVQGPINYGSSLTIAGNGTWQSVASFSITALCPRPQRLVFNTTAFVDGSPVTTFSLRLKYAGVVVASYNYMFVASSHMSMPPLIAKVTPAYPLVATTVALEVNVPSGMNFRVDSNDVYTIQIG